MKTNRPNVVVSEGGLKTPMTFVDNKARQLAFYTKAYFSHQIPYSEVDLYLWDTLEEWAHVSIKKEEPYTTKERVFWHLLHQISFWSENMLENDKYLRGELTNCSNYLEGAGRFPIDCVGIRP
jgi:hypothetical protein